MQKICLTKNKYVLNVMFCGTPCITKISKELLQLIKMSSLTRNSSTLNQTKYLSVHSHYNPSIYVFIEQIN